jgi:hypothetical protein
VAHSFFSLIIVAGVLTTFENRRLRLFVIVLALAVLALNWSEKIRLVTDMAVLTTGLTLIYLRILLAVVIAQAFQDGPVTAHRICGAIVRSGSAGLDQRPAKRHRLCKERPFLGHLAAVPGPRHRNPLSPAGRAPQIYS